MKAFEKSLWHFSQTPKVLHCRCSRFIPAACETLTSAAWGGGASRTSITSETFRLVQGNKRDENEAEDEHGSKLQFKEQKKRNFSSTFIYSSSFVSKESLKRHWGYKKRKIELKTCFFWSLTGAHWRVTDFFFLKIEENNFFLKLN